VIDESTFLSVHAHAQPFSNRIYLNKVVGLIVRSVT